MLWKAEAVYLVEGECALEGSVSHREYDVVHWRFLQDGVHLVRGAAGQVLSSDLQDLITKPVKNPPLSQQPKQPTEADRPEASQGRRRLFRHQADKDPLIYRLHFQPNLPVHVLWCSTIYRGSQIFDSGFI